MKLKKKKLLKRIAEREQREREFVINFTPSPDDEVHESPAHQVVYGDPFKDHIEADTMYECWLKLNNSFIYSDSSDSMLMPGRDFSLARYHVTMEANKGFGLPSKLPPFFNPIRRTDLLAKRYIDPAFWEPGIGRMLERRDRLTSSYPSTSVVMFNRRATNERKVPAGGGCLISINFTWFKKRWHVHILSRASEITVRLLGDLVFLEYCINKAVEEAQLKKWDPTDYNLKWTLLLPSQMKYMVPLYLLYVYGEGQVYSLMTDEPWSPWLETVQEHFWNEFIFPEQISWMQRRKWSEKFLNASNIPWTEHRPPHVPEARVKKPRKKKGDD